MDTRDTLQRARKLTRIQRGEGLLLDTLRLQDTGGLRHAQLRLLTSASKVTMRLIRRVGESNNGRL